MPANRQRQLFGNMAERQARVERHVLRRPEVGDHRRGVVTVVVRGELVAVERAQQHRALSRQDAGEVKLIEHPFDAVRVLGDVLEKENPVLDARQVRCSDEMRDQREVAAPQRPFAFEIRTVERALDPRSGRCARRPQQWSSANAEGVAAPKSDAAIGPAKVVIRACASAASWKAVKSLCPSQRLRVAASAA